MVSVLWVGKKTKWIELAQVGYLAGSLIMCGLKSQP